MKQLILLTAFIALSISAATAQKHVDIYRYGVFFKSFSTIDSAIKAADYFGDSLVLSADTFFETKLDASDKRLKYTGTISAGDTTIIDAGGKEEVVLYTHLKSEIKDIIFQNSKFIVINVLKHDIAPDTLKLSGNTIIRNNTTYKKDNNKQRLITGSIENLIIQDNVKIINNTCEELFGSSSYILKDNVLITNNHIVRDSSYKVTGLFYGGSNVSITGNVKIINNTTDSNVTAGICVLTYLPGVMTIGDSVTISNNRVLALGYAMGGAIHTWRYYGSGLGTLKLGAAILENNESEEGGAIYCDDSLTKIELNGTIFRNNKAKKGGAIYTRGSLNIKNATFENNTADTGTSIYINTALDVTGTSTVTPFISATRSRFYNSSKAANKQNHIYATYTPLTAIPPSISFDGNWWGKSDTIGVMTDKPKGTFPIYSWAKANWSVNGGLAPTASDSSFPVAAAIRNNTGGAFPASSFSTMKGHFTTDTGRFTPTIADINSSNIVTSTFNTFKDSSSKSATAHFTAWIDADTFKTNVLVWSKDSLTKPDNINNIALPIVRAYPVPMHDFVLLQGLDESYTITLYNSNGQMIQAAQQWQSGICRINTGTLATGIYHIKVYNKTTGANGSVSVRKE